MKWEFIKKMCDCSCFGKLWHSPSQSDVIATLVWKRILNPKLTPNTNDNDPEQQDDVKNYIFELDTTRCVYHCLRGKTYVENSAEYIFYYGYGAIGTVWKSKGNAIIDVMTTSIRDYLRRDLARICGINTVSISYVNCDTIYEVATSVHLLRFCQEIITNENDISTKING